MRTDLRPGIVVLAALLLAALGLVFEWLPARLILAVVAGVLLLVLLAPRFDVIGRLRLALVGDADAPDRAVVPFAIGFVFVVLVLVALERHTPFYFTQDDNLTALPVTIAGCQSLFAGVFPQWNPLQYLGEPTSVQSIFALTYPFTYLAYAIAKLLGSDAYWVEVFAIGHIVAGYAAAFFAARSMRLRSTWSVGVAAAIVLSGTSLMIGRSYAQMTPVLVWTPLLIVAVERLRRHGGNTRWALATAAVIGLYCHCGNGQMWFYSIGFTYLAIFLLVLGSAIDVRAAVWSLAAGLAGLAFCLPLAIPQMWFMKSVIRGGGYGRGIGEHLAAIFLPVPLVHAPHPDHWGNAGDMTTFYYAGTVWAVVVALAAIAIVAALIVCRRALPARTLSDNVWLFCAIGAFFIALGPQSPVWPQMSRMPLMDKFTGPWKLLLFFHIYAAPAGALVLQRMTATLRRGRAIAVTVTAAVLALLAWNASQAEGAFYNFADKPYPELAPELRALLLAGPETTRGRIFSLAPQRSGAPGYVHSLMLAFPSYYGIAAFDGYDPFVSMTPETMYANRRVRHDPAGALRRYGVRWVLVHASTFARVEAHHGVINSFESLDSFRRAIYTSVLESGTYRLRLPDLAVVELEGADPLAFDRKTHAALPIHLDGSGAVVDVRPVERGGPVTVNVLVRRGMQVFADGAPREIFHDEDGRVVVEVPPHSRTLRLVYRPPWREALLAGAATLLAALWACYAIARRWPVAPAVPA